MAGRKGITDVFGEEEETRNSYEERFQSFLEANQTPTDLHTVTFLSSVGRKTFMLLQNELMTVLQEHFSPLPLLTAERFNFHRRTQKEEGKHLQVVTTLRKLAKYCDFGQTLDNAHRDRFVCGLRNEAIHRKLLAEDPFQASGDNDIPKETKKKKVQVVNANGRQQRAVAHHKQRREYDDANPYEPMPDYSSEYVPEAKGDSKMMTTVPKIDVQTKLIEGPLSKKCCKTGCTTNAMRQLC
ncbi:uncharacterized protein [Scyliorhinus torazame]|uniref:uncharacterized protein n=1 Tax=Scyliorhinus torazame TaxID=75743 RepID=UPI003B5CF64D